MAKAPEKKTDAGLFGESPEEAAASVAEWRSLPAPPCAGSFGDYPYDGSPVTVSGSIALNGVPMRAERDAVWRTTRHRILGKAEWTATSFWAIRNSGGQRIPFEVVSYRKFEEPPLVAQRKSK